MYGSVHHYISPCQCSLLLWQYLQLLANLIHIVGGPSLRISSSNHHHHHHHGLWTMDYGLRVCLAFCHPCAMSLCNLNLSWVCWPTSWSRDHSHPCIPSEVSWQPVDCSNMSASISNCRCSSVKQRTWGQTIRFIRTKSTGKISCNVATSPGGSTQVRHFSTSRLIVVWRLTEHRCPRIALHSVVPN